MNEKYFNVCMTVIDHYIVPPFQSLGKQVWFSALRAALQQIAPIVIVGSVPTFLFLFINNILSISLSEVEDVLYTVFRIIFSSAGVVFTICMSIEIGKGNKGSNTVQCVTVGMISYLLVLIGKTDISVLPERLGLDSILIAVLTTVISLKLVQALERIQLAQRLSRIVPVGVALELSSISSILVVVLIFWGCVTIIPMDLYDILLAATHFLLRLFDSWYCFVLLLLLLQLLWFSGVHGGSSIVWGIMSPFMMILIYYNAVQVFTGGVPTGIVTQPMLFTYLMPSGVGLTLPLAIIWRNSRVESLREMSKVSIKPGIFGINETVLFGTPILRNRYFFIPFVLLTPLVGGLLGYFVTKTKLISAASVQVPWTTPLLLQPLLATGLDWRAVMAQVILFVVVYLIWLPFAQHWEKQLLAKKSETNVE